ncbi:DEAD/DEAH box helicase [Sedimentimonas flavescens]|uniref:DEAD/DEAH box helicase n=1 Tax=Sedimentimonas flavescens TaxID=2851012 RepID=UPI0021A70686|nr:DEAD/DEAH box helicase [Sedimentimonas flavescens]MCT2540324.1 DEAD/DEAH box helicase [Sedimentimonas flavescens]WBL33697.1 DEAD/DEAH box helicase [Sinirhodobacter sp. HNIBRBA609]
MTQFPHLPDALSAALSEKGYTTLTPVQEAVSDPALAGADLLVSAQTGSGKTVAFGLAMASELLADGAFAPYADLPHALIIAPTRELAQQVSRELSWLYAKAGAVITGAVGGMDARSERRALERGCHIVVGTPGRICDHIRRGALDLSDLQVVVMDEADEMLDLGFREDLEFILEAAPEERRTLMFSATVSPPIAKLAATYQKDAQRISTIAAREQHADIDYRALMVDKSDRENAIVNVLRFYEAERAIVFCSTRAAVTHLTGRLLNRGLSVVALSGELSQDERSRALQMMRDGRARVCIATDVAARGIDLPGLELVIHADLPVNREGLLHRSGRTGRAGSKGVSALIVPLNVRAKAERLLREAQVTATWDSAPGPEEILAKDQQRILQDPALTAAATAEEFDGIAQLLEAFEPRQLAAAVLRNFRAARSAPEDLTPVTVDGPKPRARAEFDRATWLRLGMGHDEWVDPKWLLPMLCRAGDLTRRDIGAIRVMQDHTFVQIHEDAAARFMTGLGPAMRLEDKCKVEVLAEAPEGLDRPAPKPARWSKGGDDRGPKKPHRKGPARDRDEDFGAPKGRKAAPWAREGGHGAAQKTDKPKAKYGKPGEKPAGKPFGKPGGKPFGKPGAKTGKPGPKKFKG